jgi:hypothetical protein
VWRKGRSEVEGATQLAGVERRDNSSHSVSQGGNTSSTALAQADHTQTLVISSSFILYIFNAVYITMIAGVAEL